MQYMQSKAMLFIMQRNGILFHNAKTKRRLRYSRSESCYSVLAIMKKLYELNAGEYAVVESLNDGSRKIATRLSDIGLTEGTRVLCTMKSPLGDPSAYLIRGAVIALRREDAAVVCISESGIAEKSGEPVLACTNEVRCDE